jgi:hypothetical protein
MIWGENLPDSLALNLFRWISKTQFQLISRSPLWIALFDDSLWWMRNKWPKYRRICEKYWFNNAKRSFSIRTDSLRDWECNCTWSVRDRYKSSRDALWLNKDKQTTKGSSRDNTTMTCTTWCLTFDSLIAWKKSNNDVKSISGETCRRWSNICILTCRVCDIRDCTWFSC